MEDDIFGDDRLEPHQWFRVDEYKQENDRTKTDSDENDWTKTDSDEDKPGRTKNKILELLRFKRKPKKTIAEIFEVKKGDVDGQDLLKFAKLVLGWLATMFILSAILSAICPTEETRKIWDFTSVAINSITSMIIGYYFAKRNEINH